MIIKSDSDIIQGYLEDASGFTSGQADKLVIPETEAELANYLRAATQRKESITICAGRTGVTAGGIPTQGTLLSLERLDAISPITKTTWGGQITVGPAVRIQTVKELARQAGLMYSPDPTEKTGTIGGNVSTNASGGQCFKYGPTRDHVLGLRVILATGEILEIKREQFQTQKDQLQLPLSSGRLLECQRPLLPTLKVTKNAAGYFSSPHMDPLDLMIGMEGTLGVLSAITLKLLPAPQGHFALAVFFTNLAAALLCADQIRKAAAKIQPINGILPAALEFMDQHSLALLRPQFSNIPPAAQALLLIEQDYSHSDPQDLLADWAAYLASQGIPPDYIWLAADDASREKLRLFRHALPETVNQIVRQRKLPKVGTDMAVPVEAFPEMIQIYLKGLQTSGMDYLIFGHIGECHLHANVLPKNQAEYQKARELYLSFAQNAVRLGGTVSAEHGIGKLKHAFMKTMVNESGLQEMARVKHCFDPAGILNRDNIFPETYLWATQD